MKFFPKSADGFLSAMMMAENALLRDFSLSCPASLFGAEPMESAKKAVKSCMTLSSFPCAQMLKTNTRYVHDFAKRTLTVTVNARYMSTGKEVNDLRCVAADIAESIKRSLLESTDFFQVIAAYQSWLKRFFVYKKTGATRDHAAVGLLQTRQGVCQAIAALSMVILPHLGILARYVCGEGYSGTDWARMRGTRYGRRTAHGTRSISHSACTAKRRRTRLCCQMIFPFASCTAGTK